MNATIVKKVLLVVSLFLFSYCTAPSKNETCQLKKKPTSGSETGYSIFKNTMADMKYPEIKKAVEENAIVLLPVAVIEEHGPHLATGTDIYLAYKAGIMLKQRLDAMNIKCIIAPPVYWGIMQLNETGAYTGSFTIQPSTMKALLGDIFTDLKRWGFKYVYAVGKHGDRVHRQTIRESISEAEKNIGLIFYNKQEDIDRDKGPDPGKFISGKLFEPDYHAGAPETSIMSSYYPTLVDLKTAKTLPAENGFHPRGYAGDPANYEKINMAGFDGVELDYTAKCVADWLKKQKDSGK